MWCLPSVVAPVRESASLAYVPLAGERRRYAVSADFTVRYDLPAPDRSLEPVPGSFVFADEPEVIRVRAVIVMATQEIGADGSYSVAASGGGGVYPAMAPVLPTRNPMTPQASQRLDTVRHGRNGRMSGTVESPPTNRDPVFQALEAGQNYLPVGDAVLGEEYRPPPVPGQMGPSLAWRWEGETRYGAQDALVVRGWGTGMGDELIHATYLLSKDRRVVLRSQIDAWHLAGPQPLLGGPPANLFLDMPVTTTLAP